MNNFQKYSRPGVYIICHLPSGRKYVGQAANMYSRWTVHITQEEFDDAAYELTCVRLYKPEGV